MNLRNLEISNQKGERLAARLDLPDDHPPRATALFAHCFTCTKESKAAAHISRALRAEGFAVGRFDFAGLGASGGEFADTSFSTNVKDVLSVADYLDRKGYPPQLLIGHSLGGAAMLQAAGRVKAARAVVTIGAPSDPAHLLEHLNESQMQIETAGEAMVELGGRPFRIKKQFVEDLKGSNMDPIIAALNCALLVLHAPQDETVGIEHAARIFQLAKHPKSFVSLDTADHLLSRTADSRYVGAMIAAWAGRYMGNKPAAEAISRPKTAELQA